MLTLRYARQTRVFLSPPSASSTSPTTTALLLFSTTSTHHQPSPFSHLFLPSPSPSSDSTNAFGSRSGPNQADIANYFREWFLSRKKPLYDRIFEILRTENDPSIDSALSRLNLSLSEELILDVFNYGKDDVLSCLKFFDWAGRKRGFHHTRATFTAIFRVLTNAKLATLTLDFLESYANQRYISGAKFSSILVIGYALAGKSETALHLFSKMRFQGADLDVFTYHVLMNSLIEEGHFDVVETIANEIRVRGFQNEITHGMMMKSFCKQNELDRGEEYLRGILEDNIEQLSGITLATFVSALCKNNQFGRAALLVEEFRKIDLVPMDHAYGVWIRELVNAGKLDGALEFLKDKHVIEGYVPDIFRYNSLLCRLLRENRYEEVFDLLVEMKERDVSPDNVTMNAILCLLCKVGRMDIALELYDSRAEFGLSVNCMAYNYLINTLLSDISVDEAYRILKNSVEQGYFPGEKTFLIIADALCREGKLDKMKELVHFTINRNITPSTLTYDKLISALCRESKVEVGYWIYNLLSGLHKSSKKSTYRNLINGFCKSGRGEIAARLLIDMQEKGYIPDRRLVRAVICCLCKMDKPEKLFFKLLQRQLGFPQLSPYSVYKFFIDGAGHAGKSELALQVYDSMQSSGLTPNMNADIILLQSYLKHKKIAQALRSFDVFSTRWRKRKLWHIMIVGLCKAKQPEYAAEKLKQMKTEKLTPSIECYEELIKLYCELCQYRRAVDLVNEMTQIGRPISSFIGNVFLLHALRSFKVYHAWMEFASSTKNLTPASWMLWQITGVFSGVHEGNADDENVEKLIQQCFHVDTYTNNLLLRRLCMKGVDYACKFFYRLIEKGYEPNRWSYDIIVHGLAKEGRHEEARVWLADMLRKGFDPTETTQNHLT